MRVLSSRGPHFCKIPIRIIGSEPVVILQSLSTFWLSHTLVFAVLLLSPLERNKLVAVQSAIPSCWFSKEATESSMHTSLLTLALHTVPSL